MNRKRAKDASPTLGGDHAFYMLDVSRSSLADLLAAAERHRGCSGDDCAMNRLGGFTSETNPTWRDVSNECHTCDQLRPLTKPLLAIRAEVLGFDRATEFGGLYTRLRDIHILLNEPDDQDAEP